MPKQRRRPLDAVIDSTLREAARRRRVVPFIPTLTLTPAEAVGLHGPLVGEERRQDRLADVIELRREPSAAVGRQRGSLESGAQLSDAGAASLKDLDGSRERSSAMRRARAGGLPALRSARPKMRETISTRARSRSDDITRPRSG